MPTVRFEVSHAKKVSQYLFFSILSLLAGYSLNHEYDKSKIVVLLSILPVLYAYNFIFTQSYKSFAKQVQLRVNKLISPSNINNVIHSHAILLSLFFVSIFYVYIFPDILGLKISSATLSILLVYTIFYFLHRILKEANQDQLFSLLKYKSYEHTHILAFSSIAMPFWWG